MSEARDRILARIRSANAGRERFDHPGALAEAAGAPAPATGGGEAQLRARVEAFARRLEASGGEVVVLAGDDGARTWLETFALEFGSCTVSPAVGDAFRPPLLSAPPEAADLGVSRAVAAAAQTGSLVLDSREGRRLQLLPPVHLVWVHADDIHATLGGALQAARSGQGTLGPGLPAALALHSGPSKSADIGRIVVTGVHGPGRLVAAVVGAAPGPDAAPGAGRRGG